MSSYLIGVGADIDSANVPSSSVATRANNILSSHPEKYIAISISDDGEISTVTSDSENDAILNNFYGTEVDKHTTRFAAIYGPPPEREELQRYNRAQKAGSIVIYSRSPIAVGLGAGAVGLLIGILTGKGKRHG